MSHRQGGRKAEIPSGTTLNDLIWVMPAKGGR